MFGARGGIVKDSTPASYHAWAVARNLCRQFSTVAAVIDRCHS